MCIFLILRFHGDIELNPGPNKWKQNNLSIFHWNLNSITAHNFLKFFKLKAYISTNKPDFLCLSETYLHSSTPSNVIDIEGYKLVCLDHPFNVKRDGVCIYYKENLFYLIWKKLLNGINKRKPSLSAIKGDFSARSSSW